MSVIPVDFTKEPTSWSLEDEAAWVGSLYQQVFDQVFPPGSRIGGCYFSRRVFKLLSNSYVVTADGEVHAVYHASPGLPESMRQAQKGLIADRGPKRVYALEPTRQGQAPSARAYMKTLSNLFHSTPATIEFLAQKIAGLPHVDRLLLPWIVYHESPKTGISKHLYITPMMEGDLATCPEIAGASERVLIDVMLQVARAVQVLHRAGCIHRDIKLGNIFYRQGQNGFLDVRLADLDTLYFAGHDQLIEARGTPGYMAPEFSSGLHGRIASIQTEGLYGHIAGMQTDIYSLGVTFARLLLNADYAGYYERTEHRPHQPVISKVVGTMQRTHPLLRPTIDQVIEPLELVADKLGTLKKCA